MAAAWVSCLIFLITIAVLLTDWVHRTIVVWVGAAAMLAVGLAMGFYTQGQALAAIDFNTLGLLLGMMMLMAMFRKTGAVEALAIVAIVSMLLNNATVILLLAPVTIMVAAHLKISPVPLLMGEAFLSNVGGTATLIGDPPNVLIGSAAGLTFNDFLIVLLPVVLVAYYPTLWAIRWLFAAELQKRAGRAADLLPSRPRDSIKDRAGLTKLLVVLGLMLALFTLQDALHLQLAVITFLGVALAMAWLLPNPGDLLKAVDWNVLLFFTSLFIAVGGLEAAGVLKAAAQVLASFAGSHVLLTAVLLLWVAALLSAVVDNIPFVVAMIPIIKGLEAQGPSMEPLWWALAIGAGFGGNATPIGASANILTIALSERAGYPITFTMWCRAGATVTLVSCAVGTLVFLVIFGLIRN
ncbi:MAG: citrate transporter [Planctomycetota bacterium]|nr:MAG: citrate transporter [Planctomycetota bacterium]